MTSRERFEEVERLFAIVLQDAARLFSNEDLEFTKQSVDAGEYGVALEEYIALARERQLPLSYSAFEAIGSLAAIMEMQGKLDLNSLAYLPTN